MTVVGVHVTGVDSPCDWGRVPVTGLCDWVGVLMTAVLSHDVGLPSHDKSWGENTNINTISHILCPFVFSDFAKRFKNAL